MVGLSTFSSLMDLCFRPAITERDLDDVQKLFTSFFNHYERDYFRYCMSRSGLCKYTVHLLLHLRENMERCGPLVNCNQFCLERYVGFIKDRLNARHLAAESLAQNAKMLEAYKLFFGQHLVNGEGGDNRGELCIADGDEREERIDGITFLHPRRHESLSSNQNSGLNIRDLLHAHVVTEEGISAIQATSVMLDQSFYSFGRVRVKCGEDVLQVGSLLSGRANRSRAGYYISAQFAEESCDESPELRFVYYGRVLKISQYTFCFELGEDTRCFLLVDWAQKVRRNGLGQVFSDCKLESAFQRPTLEELSCILNQIGVCEHEYPAARNYSRQRGKKTFMVDPYRRLHHLLDSERLSPDDVNRVLSQMV